MSAAAGEGTGGRDRQAWSRICVIIPALDEEASLPRVLRDIPRSLISEVIVADNGSADRTAALASASGATVVSEPRRGYGAACLAGVKAAREADIYVFLDGDWSADPTEIPSLVGPILTGEADLVVGSRTLGRRERGSLPRQALWGNALAAVLIRLLHGRMVTDLGPFRAIRADTYHRLGLDDAGYGYPCQMQVRAIRRGCRVLEVPVSNRRRIGRSKISGTLRGVLLAGRAILGTIVKERLRRP